MSIPIRPLSEAPAAIAGGATPVYLPGAAPGLYPPGTVVAKQASKPDDSHGDGSRAVVISSIAKNGAAAYFVMWDDMPGVPCFVAAARLRLVDS